MNAIDTNRENLVLLNKARIPGNPSIPTRWRWIQKGVRGVRLASVVIGWQRYTSVEAVTRFIEALNSPGAVATTPARSAEDANDRLAAMGA